MNLSCCKTIYPSPQLFFVLVTLFYVVTCSHLNPANNLAFSIIFYIPIFILIFLFVGFNVRITKTCHVYAAAIFVFAVLLSTQSRFINFDANSTQPVVVWIHTTVIPLFLYYITLYVYLFLFNFKFIELIQTTLLLVGWLGALWVYVLSHNTLLWSWDSIECIYLYVFILFVLTNHFNTLTYSRETTFLSILMLFSLFRSGAFVSAHHLKTQINGFFYFLDTNTTHVVDRTPLHSYMLICLMLGMVAFCAYATANKLRNPTHYGKLVRTCYLVIFTVVLYLATVLTNFAHCSIYVFLLMFCLNNLATKKSLNIKNLVDHRFILVALFMFLWFMWC